MSQQTNNDNIYTDRRLSEIMLLSSFQRQESLQSLKATSPPEERHHQ